MDKPSGSIGRSRGRASQTQSGGEGGAARGRRPQQPVSVKDILLIYITIHWILQAHGQPSIDSQMMHLIFYFL